MDENDIYFKHKRLPLVGKLLEAPATEDNRSWYYFRIIEVVSEYRVDVYNIDMLGSTLALNFRACTFEDYMAYARAAAKIICEEPIEE